MIGIWEHIEVENVGRIEVVNVVNIEVVDVANNYE